MSKRRGNFLLLGALIGFIAGLLHLRKVLNLEEMQKIK